MAKRGRKRKQGARTKSGRLSRAQAHTYDHGTDKAKAKQEQFGNDGSDAIGRAYRTGLLGDGADAKAMLDTARKIATRYKAFYQVGPITCPTADKSTGSGVAISNQETIKRKEWLDQCLDAANGYGRAYRTSMAGQANTSNNYATITDTACRPSRNGEGHRGSCLHRWCQCAG